MPRPLIGVSAAIERAHYGAWDVEATLLPRSYARAAYAAGGIPVLLPPGPVEGTDELLRRLDGLILAGGADIDPASYGAEPDPRTGETWPERDAFELALARGALESDVPLLGLCRGMQLLNVARGGTLIQDLAPVVGDERHRPTPGTFAEHEVRLEPGSLAARAVGAERLVVKSHHHQGVDRLGDGVVATGWAEPDGLVEAIEVPDRRYVLGVLWHPEEGGQEGVIPSLVEVAAP